MTSEAAILGALDIALKALGVAMRVDEYVAQYQQRRDAGATDDELKAWIIGNLDASIERAQRAIDDSPDDPPA